MFNVLQEDQDICSINRSGRREVRDERRTSPPAETSGSRVASVPTAGICSVCSRFGCSRISRDGDETGAVLTVLSCSCSDCVIDCSDCVIDGLTTAVETYGEHMGSPCDPHMFPIRSPYVRHMGKISKTTKSYVAHMLSNIWGNLWATQQHMGNIWGNVVIFAFKLALLNIWGTYGKHMGNIWETYGEHTQSNTQQNLSLPLLMQHPQGQSGFHKVCFESLFIINKDGRMNSGSTARADEILT